MKQKQIPTEEDRLVSLDGLMQIIPIKKPTIYKLIRKGLFPKPIKIGSCTLWSVKEINLYIEQHKKGIINE